MPRYCRSLVLVLSLGASIAWTIACGQDLNFDLITYHYYLGYSAFNPRFQLDFLPGSFYGYQSPLPFMPLYWLDRIGVAPVGIAVLYAAFHALNLFLLYLITESLLDQAGATPQPATVIAVWLLGAVAPIYWTLVGTSFADLSTSVPVLAGLYLVARAPNAISPVRGLVYIAAAGALVGIATGARIHNVIYAVGLLCAVALAGFPDRKLAFRATAAFSLAAFAGWLLSFAPWASKVYGEFGNPFFPLLNGVFRSPDFPASNLPFLSFAPGSFWELIRLPFRMATDAHWVYVELPLPDIRPALIAICLLATSIVWLYRRAGWPPFTKDSDRRSPRAADSGAVWSERAILIFFAASAALWLATSSNGRFGVALFLLGGLVCGVLLSRLLRQRYVLLAIAAVVLWQGLMQEIFFRQYRFNSMPWTSRYFEWALPDHLTRNAGTFVSFGFQPASTLAPRLHGQSAHVNLTGIPSVDAPGSNRVRRIINFPNRRIYGVFDVTQHDTDGASAIKAYYGRQANLWGLDFTEAPCDRVDLKKPAGDWEWLNRAVGMTIRYRPPTLLVCELVPAPPESQARALSEFHAFAKKLSDFGAACPDFFGKPLGYVRTAKQWIVNGFASSEVRLVFDDTGRFYMQQLRPPHVTLDLGRVTDDAIVADEPNCQKWFSRLSELSMQVSRTDRIGERFSVK